MGGAGSSLTGDPRINFAFSPLDNPAIVAIPAAFFLGWLGTVTDSRPADSARSPGCRSEPSPGWARNGAAVPDL